MLVGSLLLNPFVQGTFLFTVVDLTLALTLVSAVIACSRNRLQVIGGLGFSVLVVGLAWYRNHSGVEVVSIVYTSLALAFFAYVTVIVLVSVFRESTDVSADTICGALAGYLLIGVVWAFAYALLDILLPGSISGLREQAFSNVYQQYLGYSFVTLTTLGYGNVLPVNGQAEALAAAEAIVGQVYLTVLVARLVALNLAHSRRGAGRDGDGGG